MGSLTNRKYSVLVVEDDDVDREKIIRLLNRSKLPLQVHESASAGDAVKILAREHFSCAIIDYHLPDSLGSDLISVINTHKPSPTPIIMVSGNSDERVVANVMRDGVFDYLPKRNLELDQLKRTLEASFDWAEQELHTLEANTRFAQLAEGLPQLVWTCSSSGHCDFLNRRWQEFTGRNIQSQLGHEWLAQVHAEDRVKIQEHWLNHSQTGQELLVNIRIRRHDGVYRWFDTRATPQRNSNNEVVRWLGSNTDITDIEITRQALVNSEMRFHAAFESAPLGMALVDIDETLVQTNDEFEALLGFSKRPDEEQRLFLNQIIYPDDIQLKDQCFQELTRSSIRNRQFELRLMTKGGGIIPGLLSVAYIRLSNSVPCYLIQIFNLSERKRYEKKLIRMAQYDSLTNLGNRTRLNNEIENCIRKFDRDNMPFAILFCDLDNFKQINDSLGHEMGDRLLKLVAKRLKKVLRKGDVVTRLGGDEFVIVVQNIINYEFAALIANKIINMVSKPLLLSDSRIHVGVSIGIALYPTDGEDTKTLLRNADSALYEAKAKGRGIYQLYRKELTDLVHNRLVLDGDLRKAILNHQFQLYFQPVIDLATNKVVSVEALIRWFHPERGLITPDYFIPYAQEAGLIVKIDEWVIRKAIERMTKLHQQGVDINVAVNVSARQFHTNTLVSLIRSTLAANNFPPGRLVIEITEQLFLEDTENNIRQIAELKSLGVKISLDDFGVGFSSLSYIVRFMPDILKIDRSFVSKIGSGPEHDAMVRAIVGLSNVIPMNIVGEGIETSEQNEFLRNLGCHFGQGYLYARPIPEADLVDFLAKSNSSSVSAP
jgi:diguanylate cyclase (GGDEF)-like protein/PAS domain S-box-containing protein